MAIQICKSAQDYCCGPIDLGVLTRGHCSATHAPDCLCDRLPRGSATPAARRGNFWAALKPGEAVQECVVCTRTRRLKGGLPQVLRRVSYRRRCRLMRSIKRRMPSSGSACTSPERSGWPGSMTLYAYRLHAEPYMPGTPACGPSISIKVCDPSSVLVVTVNMGPRLWASFRAECACAGFEERGRRAIRGVASGSLSRVRERRPSRHSSP
jgi:hypothetical protein